MDGKKKKKEKERTRLLPTQPPFSPASNPSGQEKHCPSRRSMPARGKESAFSFNTVAATTAVFRFSSFFKSLKIHVKNDVHTHTHTLDILSHGNVYISYVHVNTRKKRKPVSYRKDT